jgi:hypothetical protein
MPRRRRHNGLVADPHELAIAPCSSCHWAAAVDSTAAIRPGAQVPLVEFE